MSKHVLILNQHINALGESLSIATHCSKSSEYHAYIFSDQIEILKKIPDKYQHLGYQKSHCNHKTFDGKPQNRFGNFLKKLARYCVALPFLKPIATVIYILRHECRARKILTELNPKVLIVYNDRNLEQMCWIKQAKRRNIRTLLVTFATSSIASDLLIRKHLDFVPLSKMIGYIFTLFAPKQIHISEDGLYSFYPLSDMLGMKVMGYLRFSPWILGGGQTDFMTCLHQKHQSSLIEQGISADKLIVTGQPSLDTLFSFSQNKPNISSHIAKKYGKSLKKQCIIFSVPHLYEEGLMDKSSYFEHINALFSVLHDIEMHHHFSVLLALHPKSDVSEYAPYALKHHLTIILEPLNEILPVATLYINPYSSTLMWARLLQIPILIIDLVRCDYFKTSEFSDIHPSLVAYDANQLHRLMLKHKDSSYQFPLPQPSKSSLFDGKNCARIVDIFDD